MTQTKRFSSNDIDTCRDWLRLFGFEIAGRRGWVRNDGALGQITFWRGKWHAAYS